MSDEDALLAAIVANPDDDTPRLVYADWLDENGRPERAEFIRLTHNYDLLGQQIDAFDRRKRSKENRRRRQKLKDQWSEAWQQTCKLLEGPNVIPAIDRRRGLAHQWFGIGGPHWHAGFLYRAHVGCMHPAPAGNLNECTIRTGGQIRGLGLAHPLIRELYIGHSRFAPLGVVLDAATRYMPLVRRVIIWRTRRYTSHYGQDSPHPHYVHDFDRMTTMLSRWKHLQVVESASGTNSGFTNRGRYERLAESLGHDVEFKCRLLPHRHD